MIKYSEIERDLDGLILSSDIACDCGIRCKIEGFVNRIEKVGTLLPLDLDNPRSSARLPEGELRQIQDRVHEIVRKHIREARSIAPQDWARCEDSVSDLYLRPIRNLLRSRLHLLQIAPHLEDWRNGSKN